MSTKYLVGIDLGTTNTVVHYVNASDNEGKLQNLLFPQVIANGEVANLPTLPSFLYLADKKEIDAGYFLLPWNDDNTYCIGEFAKNISSKQPLKVVSSAKSWLCSKTIDKKSDILPWSNDDKIRKISPVEATELILSHIKETWNYTFDAELEEQEVVLTVPASFDAIAKELTVKAAENVGLKVTLLEEPLAAFYSYIFNNDDSWRDEIEPGDTVLVCDIGGGTTDFTLIKATDNSGNLELERVAVGRHILLGGDNMDLALAYKLAEQLKVDANMKLSHYQITGLTRECCRAKEYLLATEDPEPQVLTVLGQGSSIIGNAISVELTKDVVEQIILDGFFSNCELSEHPVDNRRSGLRTFGLEYEADPVITKHLAQFLSKHCEGNFPTKILFNGGVSKSKAIVNKLLNNVINWSGTEATELLGNDPDLAVSKGACYYAAVKQGKGIRIKSGSSHSYYIGIESTMPAIPGMLPPLDGLCVVPFGLEEGTEQEIPYTGLAVVVGEITEFRFFSSTLHNEHNVGDLLDDIEGNTDLEELQSLVVELPIDGDIPAGSLIPVNLACELTETGTVKLWCISQKDGTKWKLEFELRTDSNKDA
jgi:molecular chaperone DnaK (HSP70)